MSGPLWRPAEEGPDRGPWNRNVDRRGFLGYAAVLSSMAVGACGGLAAVPVTPLDGRLRLALTDHPALREPRGALRLAPAGSTEPLYVLALEGGGWVALSPTCTHQGCTVDISGSLLVCPCHGSTYDRQGRVLRGPAERALRQYPLRVLDDDTLEIDLR